MFTIEQIKAAHSKVKSGADFPSYVQEIKKLGVKRYECFVIDGHTIYFGENDFSLVSQPKYSELAIAESSNKEQSIADIKAHQQGKTDYPTFSRDCAKSGIEKWVVNIDEMTCIYFDKAGFELLLEKISI